jgi:hypothetical protein
MNEGVFIVESHFILQSHERFNNIMHAQGHWLYHSNHLFVAIELLEETILVIKQIVVGGNRLL